LKSSHRCSIFRGALFVLMVASSLGAVLGDEIHSAAAKGDVAKVTALLKRNPGLVSSKNEDGDTPLMTAILNSQIGVIQLLLAKKARTDVPDKVGILPLEQAVAAKNIQIVKLLLGHGTNVNLHNARSGDTALHTAARDGSDSAVELLLAKKAEVDARDNDGMTPLSVAALGGFKAIVVRLLGHGASVNSRDKSRWTPLHWAVSSGKPEVVGAVLAHKPDVSAKNNKGQTAMDLAESVHDSPIATLLRNAGAH